MHSRRRVLFVTPWYPMRDDPILGVFVREYAKAVQKYNDVVVIHCTDGKARTNRPWEWQQESNDRIAQGIPTYRIWHRQVRFSQLSYFVYLWGIWHVWQHLRKCGFEPEIIHAHTFIAGAWAIPFGKLFRIPTVVREGFSAFPLKSLSRFQAWEAGVVFRQAAFVLPVSRFLQQSIQAYGIEARFQIARDAIDTTMFFPRTRVKTDGDKRILFVGRLHPVKGVVYLLRALAQVRACRDDWRLEIVGEGEDRRLYEQMVNDLGLANHVVFRGFMQKARVAEAMQNADFLVAPSLMEAGSTTVLEALASGLPIVGTNCGGNAEFVTSNSGILVNPRDADALAIAINTMLEDVDSYDITEVASTIARDYSVGAVGKAYDKIYRQVTS